MHQKSARTRETVTVFRLQRSSRFAAGGIHFVRCRLEPLARSAAWRCSVALNGRRLVQDRFGLSGLLDQALSQAQAQWRSSVRLRRCQACRDLCGLPGWPAI